MGAIDPAVRKLKNGLGALLCGALCACAEAPRMLLPSDPLTADEHFRLGYSYETQGLPDDAAKQYEKAIRLNPNNPEAWVALGNIEFKRANYSNAEEDYLRALNISELNAGALNNLAMTYLAQNKRLKEAERLAKAALRAKGPLQPYVLDTLSKIYDSEQRYPEARAAAAQAATAAASSGIKIPPPPESL